MAVPGTAGTRHHGGTPSGSPSHALSWASKCLPASVAPAQTVSSKRQHGGEPLRRDFAAKRPNQKWVGDITYVRTQEGWLYVAVLLDLYSRRIVGWAMRESLSATLTIQALDMAVRRREIATGLMHHSDRGSQYGASRYQGRLATLGIECSMSRPGNCWDNAVVESFFATLKTKLIYQRVYQTRAQARGDIFAYLETFYKRRRRHSTLGYLSPVEFEARRSSFNNRVHETGERSVCGKGES